MSVQMQKEIHKINCVGLEKYIEKMEANRLLRAKQQHNGQKLDFLSLGASKRKKMIK